MATYTHKQCPHCGRLYESYSTYTKSFSNHNGNPFLTCRFCGKTFVDKDIKEPALKPYSDRGFRLINCFFTGFWPFGFAGILLTGCVIAPETRSIGTAIAALIVDSFYFLVTGYSIKSRRKRQRQYRQEYERSYERLKDTNYAIALKNAGFNVPGRFLENSDNRTTENGVKEETNTKSLNANTRQNKASVPMDNQEKYGDCRMAFVETICEWYDSWKQKTPNEMHYDVLTYCETLDSCLKKDGQSALNFCFELYTEGVVFNSEITDHIFKQLNAVLNCPNKRELPSLRQNVVNAIEGYYAAWVLEDS